MKSEGQHNAHHCDKYNSSIVQSWAFEVSPIRPVQSCTSERPCALWLNINCLFTDCVRAPLLSIKCDFATRSGHNFYSHGMDFWLLWNKPLSISSINYMEWIAFGGFHIHTDGNINFRMTSSPAFTLNHYSDAIMTRWPPKSPASRLFIKPFVQV